MNGWSEIRLVNIASISICNDTEKLLSVGTTCQLGGYSFPAKETIVLTSCGKTMPTSLLCVIATCFSTNRRKAELIIF